MISDFSAMSLGNSLAVPSSLGDSLIILNPTARLIWGMLSEGQDPDSTANELAFHFNIPQETARRDVESVFRLWNSQEFSVAQQSAQDSPYPIDLEKDRISLSRRTYALSEIAIRVDFHSAEVEAIMQAVLGHRKCPESKDCDLLFEVLIDGKGYCLKKSGLEVAREQSPHRLRHALVYEIAKASYPDSEWLVFLHAGAVSEGNCSIVLPGMPCCGKSTLTAALTLEGFHYLCEDIAPVARGSWNIFPVQTRICLREGGWQALSLQYSGFKAVAGGCRWGKKLHYLHPMSDLRPNPLPIRCIVFPEYAPDRPFDLSPVASEDTLTRLIQTGAWFGDSLNREWIKELLKWIESTPGYQLYYQNTEQAIAAIRQLLSHE